MAIRNVNLGGTNNWIGETVTAVDLNDTFDSTADYIDTQAGLSGANGTLSIPIGGICSWAKTLSGVPALLGSWLECDGSLITDSTSPMSGQTLPDLNSATNTFLRGNSTTGGTGGTLTHDHAVTDVNGDRFTTTVSPTDVLVPGTSSATNHEPPYYDVVWVMRIK